MQSLVPVGQVPSETRHLLGRTAELQGLLVLSLERRPKPPVAEIVADTRGYAAKQQRRVGAG